MVIFNLISSGVVQQVFGVATEDMDALTFGTPVLLRHMTFSEARKMPIKEFHLSKVLEGMELSQQEVSRLLRTHRQSYLLSVDPVHRVDTYTVISEQHKILVSLKVGSSFFSAPFVALEPFLVVLPSEGVLTVSFISTMSCEWHPLCFRNIQKLQGTRSGL